jgi:hypothetical protein
MNAKQITELQQRIGVTPDGFWGPKSIAACQAYLRGLMPNPNPWPAQSQAALQEFYGSPGNVPMRQIDVSHLDVRYDGQKVNTISAHERCANSLLRVLNAISITPHAWVLREYAGVYNNRSMRNGSLPSLHARAAAIDLVPGTNGNKTHWPLRSNMPIEVMEAFAREGWLSAGAFWSRDAMHFQATR